MENQNAAVADYVATTRPATNKISVGFKCSPITKLQLVNRAIETNLTLSEYCEMVIKNFEHWKPNAERLSELEQKVAFYENKILRDLFEKHKGQTIDFVAAGDFPMSVKINSVQDAYTVLINSFKPTNND